MRENGPRGKVEVEGKTPDHDERLTKEALALNAERDRAGAEFQAERDRADAEFRRLGLKFRFFYSILGLILGLACILAGSILGLFGVVGHTSFTASLLGLTTNLNDAAPCAVG